MDFFKYILVSGFMVTALGNCAHASEPLCEFLGTLKHIGSSLMFWSAGVAENGTESLANTARSGVMVGEQVAAHLVDTSSDVVLSAITATARVAHQGLGSATDFALSLKTTEQCIKDILKNPHDPLMPLQRTPSRTAGC